MRHRRIDVAGIGWIELDEGEVVVLADVGVGLVLGLHAYPRAVDHRARLRRAVDRDPRALGKGARGAAVRLGVAAGAGAVGRLPDVRVAAATEDEVGGALGAVGERLDAGVDGAAGGGVADSERRDKSDCERDEGDERSAAAELHDL